MNELARAPGRDRFRCLGCGHAARTHINGHGLCLAPTCRLCLGYRPTEAEKAKGAVAS